MIDRHDFTENQRDLLSTAVSCGLVDAVELACMVANHGADIEALIDELQECAWVLRHGDESERKARSCWNNLRAAQAKEERQRLLSR